MIRLHIAWANALYRWRRRTIRVRFRRARYWLWANTRQEIPVRRGMDFDLDLRRWNAEANATKAASDDALNPHTPVTGIDRPAVWTDAEGRTVVRDRWGTTVLGETTDPATEMEASA